MQKKFYFLILIILSLGFSSVFAQSETQNPPKVISGGLLNDKALNLPKPPYPAAAEAVRASGRINVQVTLDESGTVISASAVSGHPLLRAASVLAARQAKFPPTLIFGQAVKVTGVIFFDFVLPLNWQSIGAALGDAEVEINTTDKLTDATSELSFSFSKESALIKSIIANFKKDGESARSQTSSLNEVIFALQQKLADQPEYLWTFELGLTQGRIGANYFDDAVLRNYLPRIKELAATMPEEVKKESWEKRSEVLAELSKLADKSVFTRKDRSRISELIDDL